jgi:hypothetical protein
MFYTIKKNVYLKYDIGVTVKQLPVVGLTLAV